MGTNHLIKPRANILVVDDSYENLKIFRVVLSWEGYDVQLAGNGELALGLARETSPDLILLDIMMPNMDGYQVCRSLKSNKRTSAIPVVFVSALDESEARTKCLEAGACAFLRKPVLPHDLLNCVEKQLESNSAYLYS